jgi:hypothetical protein
MEQLIYQSTEHIKEARQEREDILQIRKGFNLRIELDDSKSDLLDRESHEYVRTYELWEDDYLLSQNDIKSEYTLLISTVTPVSHHSSVAQIRLLSEASFSNFVRSIV